MKIDKRLRTKLKATKSIQAGGDLTDSMASLCIYSTTIDVTALTKTLSCEPTYGYKTGEPIPQSGKPARVGLWTLKAPDHLRFEEKIRYLLDATTSDPAAWRSIARTHDVRLRCATFLHSWSGGFDLPATMVAAIGRRLWQFGLTAYSADGDEIVDAFLADAVKSREKQLVRPNKRLHPTAPGANAKRRG
jgi:hypothetical protein